MRRAPALFAALVLLTLVRASAAEPIAQPAFRVMTYNIHHGEGLDGKVDLNRIARLVQEEGADIVALQEVDKGTTRTGRRDFPAELARLTGMACVFSNNYAFQGGEYGNAILTRFPVRRTANLHYRMLQPAEQRGLLQVVLEVHGRELLFMNTHLDYRPADAERLSNAQEVELLLKTNPHQAVVLCGDFNDVPGSPTHAAFAKIFSDSWELVGKGDGFTIPAEKPNKRIDYIWVLKSGELEPISIRVPTSQASDHLPVVGDFRFKNR